MNERNRLSTQFCMEKEGAMRSKLNAFGVIGKNNRNINEKEDNSMKRKAEGSGISRLRNQGFRTIKSGFP